MLFYRIILKWGGLILYRSHTQQERELAEMARAERRNQARILNEQRAEVKYFTKAIPVWLAKMGFAYWYKKSEKDMITGQFLPVKLNMAVIGPDAYYFRVDTKRLPRGVFIANLRDEKTLETLTSAANTEVKFFKNETGSWYSVETKYGRGNIPAMVGYAEMLKAMTDNTDPLAFPLGMGANRRHYTGDLDSMINLLIGGTKGGGKSNMANVMLCTLISRNHPKHLRLFLTDLKGGIEFADYTGLPHLGGDVNYISSAKPEPAEGEEQDEKRKKQPPKIRTVNAKYKPRAHEELQPPLGQTIITDPGEVLPMLAYVEAELDRRAKLLAGHAKKLSTYNKRFPDKAMSVWAVIIDELATLMEDSRYRKYAALSLSEIARKGRAVGIYLVLATQTPSSSIVPQQISNNMDSRLAFRCGNGVASGILLGSGEYDAMRLPTIPGRMIWKWGGDKIEIQAPLIADSTIRHIVAEARAGHFTDARHAELAQKADFVFKFALENLKGECNSVRLWEFIRGNGIPQNDIKMILSNYEVDENGQPEIVINDEVFILAPGIKPKRISRWLIPIADWNAKNHPHPDYDFSACRKSYIKFQPAAGEAEIQIPQSIDENQPILEFAESAVLAIEPPAAPPPNGKNGRTPKQQNEEIPDWLESLK